MESIPKADKWVPRLSLIVALVTVMCSTAIQIWNHYRDISLKEYEVTFLAKEAAYAEVIKTMTAEFFSSYERDKAAQFFGAQDRFWAATIAIRPFLSKEDYEELRRECFVRADNLCQDVFFKRNEAVGDHQAMAKRFETVRSVTEDALFRAMFEHEH